MHKLLLLITILLVPHAAFAAVISFDPQETTVGMSTPFLVGITIDSDTPVNTIRGVIDVPESMEVVDASDGNSIINLWIERPYINDARQLVFSGIVPGGFEGYRGKLLTLTIQAKREGVARFIVNPSSRIYKNDESASPQPIISRPLDLRVSAGRDNISNEIPDTALPERFMPVVALIPDGSSDTQATSSIESGHWAVSFVAQDKGSGIAGYAVAESFSRIDPADERKVRRLSWRDAESPYVLADQRLSSYVYVKAIDKEGNVRIERLDPQQPRPWYRTALGYILIALIALIILNALRTRINISRRK